MLRLLATVAMVSCLVGCGSEPIAQSVAEFEDDVVSVEPVALAPTAAEQTVGETIATKTVASEADGDAFNSTASANGDEAESPTKTSVPAATSKTEAESKAQSPRLAVTPDMKVQGFYNVDISTVILRIDEKVFYAHVGDEINRYRIESIDPPHVTVSQNDQQWTLALRQSVSRSRAKQAETPPTQSSETVSPNHHFSKNVPQLPFDLPPLPALPSELLNK